jgi:endonuclease YncB( thermonuclease family)
VTPDADQTARAPSLADVVIKDPAVLQAHREQIIKDSPATKDGRFRIVDGDTVVDTTTGQHLRLRGINTAEKGRGVSAEAANELKNYLDAAGKVTLKESGKDVYGRTVAELVAEDGSSINQKMAAGGFAPSMNFGGETGPYDKESKRANLAQFGAGVRTPEEAASDRRLRAAQIINYQPTDPGQFANPTQRKPTLLQDVGSGVRQGTDQLQADAYAVTALFGDALGSEDVRKWGMDGYQRNQAEAASNAPSVQDFTSIETGGDFFHWAAGALGQAAPSLATMVAGGGVGALAARKGVQMATGKGAEELLRGHVTKKAVDNMVERGVPRGVAERVISRALRENPAVHDAMARGLVTQAGAAAGVYATSSAQQTGEIYGELAENGIRAPGTAAAFGAAGGALDAAGPLYLMRKLFPGIGDEAAKSIVKQVAKIGGMELLIEGSTEGAQEVIALAARAHEDPNFKVWTPENRMRVYNATAAGALVGAVGGGLGGVAAGRSDQGQVDETYLNTPPENTPAPAVETPPAAESPPPATPPGGGIVQSEASQEVVSEPTTNQVPIPDELVVTPDKAPASIPQELSAADIAPQPARIAPKEVPIAPEPPVTLKSVAETVKQVLAEHDAEKEQKAAAIKAVNDKLSAKFSTKIEGLTQKQREAVEVTPDKAADSKAPVDVAPEPEAAPETKEQDEQAVAEFGPAHVPEAQHNIAEMRVIEHGQLKTGKPWKDSKGAIGVRLGVLRRQAKKLGSESLYDIKAVKDGFVIEESIPPHEQVYEDRATGKMRTRGEFVEVRLEQAKKTARKYPDADNKFKVVRVYPYDHKPGAVAQRLDAKKITQLGLDLNREEADTPWGPQRILNGWNAGMAEVLLKFDPVSTKGFPDETVVWSSKEGDVTLGQLTARLKPPQEKIDALEDTDKNRKARAGYRSQIKTEKRAGVDGVFYDEKSGTKVNIGEQTSTGMRTIQDVDPSKDRTVMDEERPLSDEDSVDQIMTRDEDRSNKIDREFHPEEDNKPVDMVGESAGTVLRNKGPSAEAKAGQEARNAARAPTKQPGDTYVPDNTDPRAAEKAEGFKQAATKRTGITKVGETITSNELSMVQSLAKLVGLQVHITIVDEAGLKQLRAEGHPMTDHLNKIENDKPLGRALFTPDSRDTVIFISKKATGIQRVAVFAHELGHIAHLAMFDTLSATHPARVRLVEGYTRDLMNGRAGKKGFYEWYANQFVAWVARRQAPSSVVEKFFKDVFTSLKKMWNELTKKYKLNQNFGDFMDAAVTEANAGRAQMFVGETDPALRLHISKDAPLNFTMPEWVAHNKVVEFSKYPTKKLLENLHSFAKLVLLPADTVIRGTRAKTGELYKPAVMLANILKRRPGTQATGAEKVYDYKGNEITDGYLDAVVQVTGMFMHPAEQVLRRVEAKHKKLPRKEREAAVTADHARMSDLLNRNLDDAELGRRSPEALALRNVLEGVWPYLKKALPDLGQLPKYWPHVFDRAYLETHRDEFVGMLKRHWKRKGAKVSDEVLAQDAEAVYAKIMDEGGFAPDIQDTTERAGMPAGFKFLRERGLKDVPADEMAEFLSKDLTNTMASYIKSAVRRAEMERRVGRFEKGIDGEGAWNPNAVLDKTFAQAKKDLTPAEFAQLVKNFSAARGTQKHDISPETRHALAWVQAYQNYRTLLFPTISSIPDLGSAMVRSRAVKGSFSSLQEAIKALADASKGKRNELAELAASMALMEEAATNQALHETYATGNFNTPNANKANDLLFKYNGLHYWTQLVRVMGLALGKRYLHTHSLDTSARSTRYLKDLGLTAKDVQDWERGGSKPWSVENINDANAEKIGRALNQFVNEAAMRPDGSMRPAWANDPRLVLFWHLKSFMYAFHQTFIMGTYNEMKARRAEGSGVIDTAMPALAMTSVLLPLAMGALALRNLLQHELWGTEPTYSALDAWEVLQRSGGLGYAQLAADMDEAESHGSLAFLAVGGPTVSQFQALVTKPFSSIAAQSVPLLGQIPAFRNLVTGH